MTATYERTKGRLETYFDRTAADTWARLTSDAPVSRIRATVRAGRDRMRGVLLGLLPEDMTGLRLLDAGCGVGQLAVEAARRGAEVVATDISPTLVGIARDRAREAGPLKGRDRLAGRRHAGRGARPLRPRRRDGQPDPLPPRRHRRRAGAAGAAGLGLDPVHRRARDAAAHRHAHGRQALPAR
jgi:SAM-dependent methyltransferase